MIQNQKQLSVTKEQIRGFEERLNFYESSGPPKNRVEKAQRDAIASLLDDLRTELEEYERNLSRER